MNNRIKELAEQARKYADDNEQHWKSGPSWDSLFEAKFAELIVIECAKIASDSVIDHSGHSETNICPKYLACHIKDHFGVQE